MVSEPRFARFVARPVDRVHIAASTVPTRDELFAIEGHAVSPGDAAMMAAFLGESGLSFQELRLPLRYVPEERIRAVLARGVEKGVITFEDETMAYTPDGLAAAQVVLDARAQALEQKWSNAPGAVPLLLGLLAPVAQAAVDATKPSSQIVERSLPTPNPTNGDRLWRLLAKVRRFRADCHAGAWAELGYTLETIVALPVDAPERKPIEQRTDEINAIIWSHLNEANQLPLMAALASLDGSGTPT